MLLKIECDCSKQFACKLESCSYGRIEEFDTGCGGGPGSNLGSQDSPNIKVFPFVMKCSLKM